MRTYEKKTRPREIYTDIDKISCDVCGRDDGGDAYSAGTKWGGNDYGGDWTSIAMTTGVTYPDGSDFRKRMRFDICPGCFLEMADWLKSRGAKPEIYHTGDDYDERTGTGYSVDWPKGEPK